MMQSLLPSPVVCVEAREDDPSAVLLPEEAAGMGRAIESRVREFATGRVCARRALARLGVRPAAISRGENREPVWPPGVAGSITHCPGYRAAAVARHSDILTIGIDAELDMALPEGVAGTVLTGQEADWLRNAPPGLHWDRLFFSAKESVFKAWFPITGTWLGFEDVAVTFDPAASSFEARVLIPAAISSFPGRYTVCDGLILTATCLPSGMPRKV